MAGRAIRRPGTVASLTLHQVDDPATQRAFDQTQDAVQDLQVLVRRQTSSVSTLTTAAAGATTWINVAAFGAVGDGSDATAALQKAITDSPGKTLFMPAGSYRVNSTLLIADRSTHIVGDFGNRSSDNGTEIAFYGTGPAIQIGVDNGLAWNIGSYSGPQDQLFENLHIRHGAPDTALTSVGDASLRYKAGAYGIWDWRGGGIVTRNVGIEGFEANFVGIESDFDDLEFTVSLYSKYGIYIGPRSDQCVLKLRDSFFCDRAITVDGARQVRILDSSFVGCGHSTASPIEIRRASGQITISEPWFEHLNPVGYAGTDAQSCISVGEVDGYGTGGSIQSAGGTPNTISAVAVTIENPLLYVEAIGNAYHVKSIATVGKCHGFVLRHPEAPPGISLSNFDSLVGIQAAQAPNSGETQILVDDVNSSMTLAQAFTNGGAGSPAVEIRASGASGTKIYATSRFSLHSIGAATGADQLQITQENGPGQVWFQAPQYTGGQVIRMRLTRSVQPGARAAAPTTGTWEQGDRVYNEDPIAGGFVGWVCVTTGTPGTWKSFGVISP